MEQLTSVLSGRTALRLEDRKVEADTVARWTNTSKRPFRGLLFLIQVYIHAVVGTKFTFLGPLLSVTLQRHSQVRPTFTVTDLTHTVLKQMWKRTEVLNRNARVGANNHFHSKALVLLNTVFRGHAVLGVPQINVHFTATEHSHEWRLKDRDKPSLHMIIRIQLFNIEWYL